MKVWCVKLLEGYPPHSPAGSSLVCSPYVLPSEEMSGEPSRSSSAYYEKVVRTNEIAGLLNAGSKFCS